MSNIRMLPKDKIKPPIVYTIFSWQLTDALSRFRLIEWRNHRCIQRRHLRFTSNCARLLNLYSCCVRDKFSVQQTFLLLTFQPEPVPIHIENKLGQTCQGGGGNKFWFWQGRAAVKFESRPIQIPIFRETVTLSYYQLAQF